jgi:hypothetical protein
MPLMRVSMSSMRAWPREIPLNVELWAVTVSFSDVKDGDAWSIASNCCGETS